MKKMFTSLGGSVKRDLMPHSDNTLMLPPIVEGINGVDVIKSCIIVRKYT